MYRSRYLIGLITLVLAVAGAWFLLGLLGSDEDRPGLSVRVEFRDARGLRAGADVRYRGVTVGAVRSVQITDDGTKAFAGEKFEKTVKNVIDSRIVSHDKTSTHK